jgi:hypothetical protein
MAARATCEDCSWSAVYRTVAKAVYAGRQHRCATHLTRVARAERVEQRRTASGVVRDCQHKIADHQHGTYAAYVLDRCRCRPCRDAVRDKRRHEARMKAYGSWQPYVDAEPVRAHIRALAEAGVGYKLVGQAAGVSYGAMSKLIYGTPTIGRKPSRRIRTDTAERILAVTVEQALVPSSRVDADLTWRRIHSLIALGYTRAWISAQIGRGGRALQIRRARCEKRTADAVATLYRRVGDTPAPPSLGATRAVREAQRNGWPVPAAWDDTNPQLGPMDVDLVDEIAVELACAGEPVTLTQDERIAAVHRLAEQGHNATEIGRRLQMSRTYVLRYLERAAS